LVDRSVYGFCSRFEFLHRDLGKDNITAEVVGIEDRLDVLEAVFARA